MTKKFITNSVGLTKDKKEILKEFIGSASSEQIDFNKVRDEYKTGGFKKEYECEWVK